MIRVVTDSSCDLPQEVLEELGIVVVPLVVRIGNDEFLETDLSIDEYWTKVEAARAQGLFPQTSQPSVGAFESEFTLLVSEGNEVACVTITSHHSGTFNSAWAAAQRFGEAVSVVDSWQASLGLGFQVRAAAQAAREGASLDEVVAWVREMRARAHLLAVLDTYGIHQNGWTGRCTHPHPVAGHAISEDQAHRRVCRGRARTVGAGADIPRCSGTNRPTNNAVAAL
jgi:DegV family protein with EDD domain